MSPQGLTVSLNPSGVEVQIPGSSNAVPCGVWYVSFGWLTSYRAEGPGEGGINVFQLTALIGVPFLGIQLTGILLFWEVPQCL